jgi:hypothetical protein
MHLKVPGYDAMDWIQLADYSLLAASYEHSSAPSGCIKGANFLTK